MQTNIQGKKEDEVVEMSSFGPFPIQRTYFYGIGDLWREQWILSETRERERRQKSG